MHGGHDYGVGKRYNIYNIYNNILKAKKEMCYTISGILRNLKALLIIPTFSEVSFFSGTCEKTT